jgi:hypothetical protein
MQTNFQDRQASLITEAIETIQEQVKLKGTASKHDYNQPVIPIVGSNIYDDAGGRIEEVGANKLINTDGMLWSIYDIESKSLMQLADYCLNYKA